MDAVNVQHTSAAATPRLNSGPALSIERVSTTVEMAMPVPLHPGRENRLSLNEIDLEAD